jgi:hypothetical protein
MYSEDIFQFYSQAKNLDWMIILLRSTFIVYPVKFNISAAFSEFNYILKSKSKLRLFHSNR